MLTAARLLDRLCRAIVGDDPVPDGAWVRVTEAIGDQNWVLTLSHNMQDHHRQRCHAECDLLHEASRQVDWSEVTQRRGLVREIACYLDGSELS